MRLMPMPRKTTHVPVKIRKSKLSANQVKLYAVFVYKDPKHYGFLRYSKSFPTSSGVLTSNTLVKSKVKSSKFIDPSSAKRTANRLFKSSDVKTLITKDDMTAKELASIFES